ncbi:hypothetical protein ISS03_02890 [Patescibacteria group bacterium]|nr:hypothetical protein [Patescibacteria group bacterium]
MENKISKNREKNIRREAKENQIFKILAKHLLAIDQKFKEDVNGVCERQSKLIYKFVEDLLFMDKEFETIPKKYASTNISNSNK